MDSVHLHAQKQVSASNVASVLLGLTTYEICVNQSNADMSIKTVGEMERENGVYPDYS